MQMHHQVSKGLIDIYMCSCGAPHCVVSMNIGVVPDVVRCEKCKKSFAQSISGRIHDFCMKTKIQNLSVVFCWYRPTLEEYLTMNDEMRLFVERSGLLWGWFGEPAFIHDPTAERFEKLNPAYNFEDWVKDHYTISKG